MSEFQYEMTTDGPKLIADGPDVLFSLLQKLEESLIGIGVFSNSPFAQGLASREVVSKLGMVGLDAPDELAAWFAWHNGCVKDDSTANGEVQFLPKLRPATLDTAAEKYLRHLEYLEAPVYLGDGRVVDIKFLARGGGRGWFPLSGDINGPIVDCSGPTAESPRLRLMNPDFANPGNERIFRAVSLCTLVAWWIEGIEAGAYEWDPELNVWEEDFDKAPSSQRAALFF